ncbi:MAG: Na+/H+ antiporter subunit E [Cyanobacterium sp. T60_A2020_053]|nr:Na+/H+ antiporter subunit E [Cyanobacterium sp. T60_A2020_053]
MVASVIFRLILWFLLTANFSIANIIIGLIIALILPPYNIFSKNKSKYTGDLLKEIIILSKDIIIAIPQAYREAIEMIFTPHRHEEIVKPNRSKLLIFLETYIITFTPKAVVVNYDDRGWYNVHYVRRKAKEIE